MGPRPDGIFLWGCVMGAALGLAGTGARTAGFQAPQAAADGMAREFAMAAMRANTAEIDLAALAVKRGRQADLATLAGRIERERRERHEALLALAAVRGWSVPEEADKAQTADVQRLGRLTGDEFATAYLGQAVKNHERDVRAFEQALRRMDDGDLRQWVRRTLPTLRDHLEALRVLRDRRR